MRNSTSPYTSSSALSAGAGAAAHPLAATSSGAAPTVVAGGTGDRPYVANANHKAPPFPYADPRSGQQSPWPTPVSGTPVAGYPKILIDQTPVLPIPQSQMPPPQSASGLSEIVAAVKSQGQSLLAARRPWGEVFSTTSFSTPGNFSVAFTRIGRNSAYFRANYSLFVIGVLLLSLFYHPFSFLAFAALVAAWYFLYFARSGSGPLVIFGRPLEDGSLLAILTAATVFTLLFTDAGWNVVGSFLVGIAIVGAHAAFRSTDDLFLSEQEAAGGALGPEAVIIAGAGAAAAAAAAQGFHHQPYARAV